MDANLSVEPQDNLGSQHEFESNDSRYDFQFVTGDFYLLAFFDANSDGQLDSGEPFQIYNEKTAPPGDPVTPGPNQTRIDFTFGDPTTVKCVGDCDGSGNVTVNEIITLVNMALGNQTALTTCLHGIPPNITDVSQINVSLIIQAVNNALNGCPAAQ
jgi:hypothetical protein